MGKVLIYKLFPRSPFHFGERGVGIEETAETLHSDTLFSAILSAWRALGERMDEETGDLELSRPFLDSSPPLRLSSAFPFAGDILFFPRPLVTLGRDKRAKKVTFVSQGVMERLTRGDTASEKWVYVQGNKVWVTEEEKSELIELLLADISGREREGLARRYHDRPKEMRIWVTGREAIVPRVAIDRFSSTSALYFCGRVYFAKGCGLYLWVEIEDTSYQRHLERALDFLSDEGVGGRRTEGCGQFVWRGEEAAWSQASEPKCYLMLSLYHPTEGEVVEEKILEKARYGLIDRRGWIASPDGRNLRRKGVRMLREGSVLAKRVMGDVADVTPQAVLDGEIPFPHHIYRYGLAFPMGLGLEVER